MPYINLTTHEKLLLQFNNLKPDKPDSKELVLTDTQSSLDRDINKLDRIAKDYKQTVTKLQNFSDEYDELFRKIRISLRKFRIANARKLSKYN